MEIQFLTNKQINREKWDVCIANADCPLPYVLSWYLDASTGNQWHALVAGDYCYVMPLPYNKKIPFFPQVYQPILSQQLGIFGRTVSTELMERFIQSIPSKFSLTNIPFNHCNPDLTTRDHRFALRTNLILDLNRPYNEIKNNYAHGLRQRLKKAAGKLKISETDDTWAFQKFCMEIMGNKLPYNSKQTKHLKQLLTAIKAQKAGRIYRIIDTQGNTCAMGLFLIYKDRIINLMNASTENGRKSAAIHYMFDTIIHKYQGKAVVFDFEGSEIPGVRGFFESFGAQNAPYTFFRHGQLPGIVLLGKRLITR